MFKVLGSCIIQIIIKKGKVSSNSILFHLITEMEKTSDIEEFRLYRDTLEFFGTLSK
ncbi:biofilm development regulator YmgB/AriR family protein [Serratia sp. CY85251]|uniref:biofilm development regulator YmgB/AriR family protein n=1 Tax=Serratia sp. CY85251 TaxID=3383696 RepID=UPI003FA13381